MAEEVLKKLEEGLNCSICLDTYTDPKLLQCFHTYCRKCLVPLVDRNQQGQLGLTCPICRQVTPIPDRGVAGLQPALHISHLLDIQDSIKKLDNPAVATEGAEGGASVSRDPVKCCFEHLEEEVKIYCEPCGELVCYKCVIREGKHENHDYEEIDEAFHKYKAKIMSSLAPMEKQVMTINKALARLDARRRELSDQRAATQDKVHPFRQLHVMEAELVGVLESKLESLAVQRNQLETTLVQLRSCLYFMRESLKTGNKVDILMMKASTEMLVKELTAPLPLGAFEASTEENGSAEEAVSINGGSLSSDPSNSHAKSDPSNAKADPKSDPSNSHAESNPSNSRAESKSMGIPVVGETFTCFLRAKQGKKVNSLECRLLSKITGVTTSCSVKRKGHIHFQISYQPTIKGKHHLHVKADGEHIKGSPFSIAVRAPVEKLGPPILTIAEVSTPLGVAVTPKGDVVVSEHYGHCVSVFSPGGKKRRSFGQFLNYPAGVAVDGKGNILVTDAVEHSIQKFSVEGRFIDDVPADNSCLKFSCPRGVAFNASNGKVYVIDSGNSRCLVLNSDLTFFSAFGGGGHCEGQFQDPWGVACDSTGKVYVADYGNKRVQVFTAEGGFVRMFGEHGYGERELDFPSGVAVDSNGMVYIGERNRVSVFASNGRFTTSFGKDGILSEFKPSCGIAVDASGVVYVCDQANNQVFLH